MKFIFYKISFSISIFLKNIDSSLSISRYRLSMTLINIANIPRWGWNHKEQVQFQNRVRHTSKYSKYYWSKMLCSAAAYLLTLQFYLCMFAVQWQLSFPRDARPALRRQSLQNPHSARVAPLWQFVNRYEGSKQERKLTYNPLFKIQ